MVLDDGRERSERVGERLSGIQTVLKGRTKGNRTVVEGDGWS